MLNGKHRDFNVDTTGKLRMVELFVRGGRTMYEAYTTKAGKKHVALFTADGAESKS